MAQLGSNARSLRMSEDEAKNLMRLLKEQSDTSENLSKRSNARVGIPEGYSMLGTFQQPGGSTQTFLMTVRDLSRTGLGMLHSGFMHKDTKCELVLVGRDRQPVLRTSGRVVRCIHIKGPVHEVGIVFEKPADLEAVLPALQATEQLMARSSLLSLVDQVYKQLRASAPPAEIKKTVQVILATLEAADEDHADAA